MRVEIVVRYGHIIRRVVNVQQTVVVLIRAVVVGGEICVNIVPIGECAVIDPNVGAALDRNRVVDGIPIAEGTIGRIPFGKIVERIDKLDVANYDVIRRDDKAGLEEFGRDGVRNADNGRVGGNVE